MLCLHIVYLLSPFVELSTHANKAAITFSVATSIYKDWAFSIIFSSSSIVIAPAFVNSAFLRSV